MKSLRFFAVVVVFSLAGAALADPHWPAIPRKPTGTVFTANQGQGDWHSASTWKGHAVPGKGAVVIIPFNATVTLSGTTENLRWVEVNGSLILSSTLNTTMFVDTLRITVTGKFTLNSLPGNLTAKVIFTSNGQLVPGDKQQVSRGLIGEGVVHIMGLQKDNMATVSTDLTAGTTQFNLNAAPLNWTHGDSIVIAGTHFRRLAPMQDERCTIRSINGAQITIDCRPIPDPNLPPVGLTYDHLLTSTANNQSPQNTPVLHVANLTRNVVFSSASTTNTIDRGHVLIGHQDSDIENVEFVDLGRTDKSRPLNDYAVSSNLTPVSNPTNMRGRYPLYVFNTVGNPPNVNEQIPRTTVIKGCVVERSIGWAFANRRSRVDFTNNVAYNFIGAGFVAEGGDELGSYAGNIAIHGIGQIVIDQPLHHQTTDFRDVNNYRKQRLNFMNPTRPQPLEDIAFNGEGFWFSGPALHVDGNVANSCHGTGMIWHPTGVVEVSGPSTYPFGSYTYFPQAWIQPTYGAMVPSAYPQRHWRDGTKTDEILTGDLPLLYCNNFTGYANFVGFRLRFSNADNDAWYNETPTKPWNYQSQVVGDPPSSTTRPYQKVSNLNLWNNEAAITLTYDANTNFFDVNGINRLDYDENRPYPDPGISPNYGLETYFIVANLNWTKLTLDGYELATWTDSGPYHASPPLFFGQQTNLNSVHNGLWSSNCSPPGPPSVSTDGTGTVTWAPAPDALAYLVRYRALGAQQWSFTAPQNPPPPPQPPPTTAHISGLNPAKVYQIQVDAGCSTGLSQWVTGHTFNGSCAPAAISVQPNDAMNVASGQVATFSVAASGAGPFSYQWYEGTAGTMDNPVGGNSNVLSVMPAASTSYWVNVTNACGAASSNAAMVTVCDPPAIVAQTQSQTITAGSPAALSVTAGGNGPFTYQWYQGEAPSMAMPIGTGSSLTVTPSETTSYWVNVTNGCGSTASDTVVVTVCDPPAIAEQPISQTIPAGSAVTLDVLATGSGPFTYQWYLGAAPSTANPIPTDDSPLTVAPASTTSYWVSITNGCGSVASNTVTVTLCNPPTITVQPQSQTITAGSSATLSVTACCDGPFSYQWYSGVNPVGNGSTLTVSPAFTTTYWVIVSNSCSWTSSTTATVTVCGPVSIVTQPLSQTVGSGSPATLTVAASGGGSYSYQWYEGTSGTVATPVGTNSSTFVTPPLTAMKSYWVRVTSTCLGTYTADSATATISVQIQIVRRQLAGNNANSMPSLTTNWSQPTQAGSLLVAVISASDVGQIGAFTPPAGWQLANTNSYSNIKTSIYYYPNNPGGRTAETFSLTYYPDSTLDLIEYMGVTAVSPLDQTAIDEGSAPIGMVAVDTGMTQTTAKPREVVLTALTTYAQTSFTTPTNSFVKIDEQSVLYHLTTAVHESLVTTTGSYGHQANVGGNAQWVGLAVTFMAVDCTGPPTISAQPASATIAPGQQATLTVTAAGSGLNYQWYQGTAPSTTTPIGTNSSSLTVTPAATTSYWVNVSSPCGSTASSTATITLCTLPVIAVQPLSQTITAGSSATLSVTASGNGPFSYQWYQGPAGTITNPIGTNSSTLTVTPATTTSYWVKVSNGCGATNSNTATVTVCNPAVIVTQPSSQTIPAGSPATLSVTAGGSTPFTYQWYQGASGTTTTPVGTNSSTFTVTPAATTSYWVKVTNSCGSASSNTATITLCTLPGIAVQPLSQSSTAGSSVTLSVTASGNGPFSYQWYQGPAGTITNPIGTNSSTIIVAPTVTTSYWVKVSNSCGATNSNTATVTVCNPAVIVTQPSSQSIPAGSSATLSVAAGGGTPFSYQWYQGSSGTTTTPVGTNSSTFTVTPAVTTSYWVKVTNSCGAASSNTATITVLTHITRRQLASNNANSMSTLTANWTQATQAGSLLVGIISASDGYAIGAFTPPAGWQLANTYAFNNVKTSIYYYPNNPGGRTAETFYLTNYPDSTLDLIEYTGVMAASPLDKTGFDGGWNPVNGIVTSGTTQSTAQSKEVVITALTTYAQTSFTNATNGFTKLDEQGVLYHLTTAVHENIVTTAGGWGHSANAGGSAQWVGLVVTFKSADTSP